MQIGPPVGISGEPPVYEEHTFTVAPRTTVILYTDGLIERRGEVIDAGLERLRKAATANEHEPLDTLVQALARELAPPPTDDDTAILAIRWRT